MCTINSYSSLDTQTQDNNTALYWASLKGHLATVQKLIEAGATFVKNKVSVHVYIRTYMHM